ncbi:hypothetical protein DMC25_19810 [Caulobacter sp. D4A]|uniref:hypothetical protein n=1 Tax=unclassified Caulobacter TaxID=2648921 RepID=UPI000D736102|nr:MULTISPECIES: hypothetical protein [unclassified Caulobacter]PXA82615.1 hypothetical protein DMC25_19810 [Caulobacter sp. D4A]PXA86825.1 hypothetical protein DMC18_21545 [Caulobacter sp. D5]
MGERFDLLAFFARSKMPLGLPLLAAAAVPGAIIGLLLFYLPDLPLDLAFFGGWLALLSLAALVWATIFWGLAVAVTPQQQALTSASVVAVAMSLAIASVASPPAIGSLAQKTGRVVEAALAWTPALVSQAVSGIDPCSGDALTKPEQRRQAVLKGRITGVLHGFISRGDRACTPADLIPAGLSATSATAVTGGAWIWFLIVFGLCLVLARALAEARLQWYPGDGSREPIIAYPKWIAAVVYTAILIPASYLAIGSLLLLTQETTAVDQAELNRRLDEVEAKAMSNQSMEPLTVNTGLLLGQAVNAANAVPPSPPAATVRGPEVGGEPAPVAAAVSAALPVTLAVDQAEQLRIIVQGVNDYQKLSQRFEQYRVSRKLEIVAAYNEAVGRFPPSQLPGYVDILVERYREQVVSRRLQLRQCLGALAGVQTVSIVDRRMNLRNLAAAAPYTEEIKKTCKAPTETTLQTTSDEVAADRNLRLGNLIERVLYRWLIGVPASTLLILGLIGFGLFGAAIRMLGRPDRPEAANEPDQPVDAAARARVEDLFARSEVLTQTPPPADDDVSPQAERQRQIRRQEILALKALALRINAASRSDHAGSNNIVYFRANYVVDDDGLVRVGERVAVSGAPARVLVHGMGAAFTIFLLSECGARLFNEGGQTNPIGMLAMGFIGAVFAEDIWKRAREVLGDNLKRKPEPKSPPEPAPQSAPQPAAVPAE